MSRPEQHTLSAVIQVARQLDRVPTVRDAMSVLDEESIRNGRTVSASSTAAGNASSLTPAAPAGSSTSLAPGPMELGAVEANSGPKRSRCARCGARGPLSPVCHTPRDWKETDSIVGEGMTKKGSGKRPERGVSRRCQKARVRSDAPESRGDA